MEAQMAALTALVHSLVQQRAPQAPQAPQAPTIPALSQPSAAVISLPPVFRSTRSLDEDEEEESEPSLSQPQPSTSQRPAPQHQQPASYSNAEAPGRRVAALLGAQKSQPFLRQLGAPSTGSGTFKQQNRGGGYHLGGHPLQQTSRPSKKAPKEVKVCKLNMVSVAQSWQGDRLVPDLVHAIQVAFIPDGSIVRERLSVSSPRKEKWIGFREYLSTNGYMQPLHLTDGMTPKDMVKHVEDIFAKSLPGGLPKLWQWAAISPKSHFFHQSGMFSPWQTTLMDIRGHFLSLPFVCIVPESWETVTHKTFRRGLAEALGRDPVTWADELAVPMPKLKQAVIELDDEESGEERDMAEPEGDPRCDGCGEVYPDERMKLHVQSCKKLGKRPAGRKAVIAEVYDVDAYEEADSPDEPGQFQQVRTTRDHASHLPSTYLSYTCCLRQR